MRSLTALLVAATAAAPSLAQDRGPTSTWGIVESITGPYLTLDDGSVLRLRADTPIHKADGSAGTRADILRGSKVILSFDRHGSVAGAQVFAPRPLQEVYIADVAPMHGGANVIQVETAGEVRARSLATLQVTYARPTTYTAFRTDILYDPGGAARAPAAARFAVSDALGTVLVESTVSAREVAHLGVGLDPQAGDRLVLEVTPVADAPLQQSWCLWLDPHYLVQPSPGTAISGLLAAQGLVTALAKAPRPGPEAKVAVAQFTPVRVRDDDSLRDLQDDLLVSVGRSFSAAGKFAKRLVVGAPLADADREQLRQLGAEYVLVGSISARTEGTLLDAVLVNVETGGIVAGASVWE